MPWIESASPSFRARHDSADADDAAGVLNTLEDTRGYMAELFPVTVEGLVVVLHGSSLSLAFASPVLPAIWLATAPSARRYVGGWAGRHELHVLAPRALNRRASNVAGSREMLWLTTAGLYARRVVSENNHELARARGLSRVRLELRWAWLIEGAGRWFSGQTDHARPAIARRLREGGRPSFPPGLRDAPLLGGTVIDLLAREEGEPATAQFVRRLHPQGPRAALSRAFGGRPFTQTEAAWRSHLTRIASAT